MPPPQRRLPNVPAGSDTGATPRRRGVRVDPADRKAVVNNSVSRPAVSPNAAMGGALGANAKCNAR
eukprot:6143934-Lingulodinium_polyedra.AAC.1